jgi:hypothetical protein
MSSLQISLTTFGCLLGGVLLGMRLHDRLPNHHLSKESQDTVKLGAGMVATMSALILGLLVSSAKSSFDAMNNALALNSAKIIQLDYLLSEYGPEAQPLRVALKQGLAGRVDAIWAHSGGLNAVERVTVMLDFQRGLHKLAPANDAQKSIFVEAQRISTEVWQSRLIMIEQQQAPVSPVLLALLVFWLTLLFTSFGLFAPRNLTVFSVLFVCALSVASAVFLILELSHPLSGYIKASSAPLLKALELIGN